MPKQNGNPKILAAGAAVQLLTGIPAAWGVFQKPVMAQYGFSRGQAMLSFPILVAGYGIGCAIGGFVQDQHGPRYAALWGTALLGGGSSGGLHVTVLSFGFKNGLPPEADLVLDVRFLPNPYYVPELKRLTGLDVAVRDYVMNAAATEEFWRRLTPIVDYLLPQYRQGGRTGLVLAVGWTGGRHRSVAVAHRLAAYIDALGFSVAASHRDMGR